MDHVTAMVSCFVRAYHYKNKRVHIFEDNAAELLLGSEYDKISQNLINGINFFLPEFQGTKEEGLRLIVDNQLSPSVLGRSAYCEKKLEETIHRGCRQYILFASGYDTFAVRNKEDLLSVFEIDLPEVLTDKLERIEKAGIKSEAAYVSCNLATDNWKEKLMDAGFKSDKKSFGSLLGISYYLSKEDFKCLLKSINDIFTQESVICFDFPSEKESKETKINQMLAQEAGEKMKSLFSDEEMEALLMECGFSISEHLDYEEITKQYFSEYNKCDATCSMQAPIGVEYVLAVKR